jgi:hypothetical protein
MKNCKQDQSSNINQRGNILSPDHIYYWNFLCPMHGLFLQNPSIHLRGSGCPTCRVNLKYTNDDVINEIKTIYNDLYKIVALLPGEHIFVMKTREACES